MRLASVNRNNSTIRRCKWFCRWTIFSCNISPSATWTLFTRKSIRTRPRVSRSRASVVLSVRLQSLRFGSGGGIGGRGLFVTSPRRPNGLRSSCSVESFRETRYRFVWEGHVVHRYAYVYARRRRRPKKRVEIN